MPELTEQELDEIGVRVTAAASGPWWASWEGRDHTSGDSFIRTGSDESREPDIYVSTDDGPASLEDLDFVAHACQDIPRLIHGIRRPKEMIT